jgi:dimethylargininase
VRLPGRSMEAGLTTARLGPPDYRLALIQHARYVEALRECGLEVTILEADERYPDSVFIEDTAVLTPRCAVITNPGAASRRGEIARVAEAIQQHYATVERIRPPGTLEGGDVMMTDSEVYVGVSERTNASGARQLLAILEHYGIRGSMIPISSLLHLKSGANYLDNGHLVVCRQLSDYPDFPRFHRLVVDTEDDYSANCVCIKDTVLVAAGYPKTQSAIERLGYRTVVLDVSEYRKLDGGLTCLSLRF